PMEGRHLAISLGSNSHSAAATTCGCLGGGWAIPKDGVTGYELGDRVILGAITPIRR
ncbi:MAG: hypothetical protein RL701_4181, partial [Pseudomonadota bacterium]